MSRRLRALLGFVMVAADTVAAAGAFYASYYVRAIIPFPTALLLGPFWDYAGQMIIHVLSLLMTLFFMRIYHTRRGTPRIDMLYSIVAAISISTAVSTTFSFLIYRSASEMARAMTVYTWLLTTVFVGASHAFTGLLWREAHRRWPERLLLVGTGEIARMILQKTLQSPTLGYRVIGFVDGVGSTGDVAGHPILGSQAELEEIVREHDVHEVVIALPEATHDQLLEMISACESQRAIVRIFPDLFQIIASDLQISDLDGLPLLTVRDVALRGWKLTVKRGMDIVFSAAGLIILSPFLLLVALLVMISSRGPAFYWQERVGLDGKPFPVLKFRTMRTNAEDSTGPVWASENDPRRTRIGEFLRKSSIDELPQLINVLIGDMSLVGPRPERPVFVDQFRQVVPRYMERHKEKAGITGWAQVNGLRGDTSIVERTKYDLYYIENWSLWFDFKILIRTVLNQLRGDHNAY